MLACLDVQYHREEAVAAAVLFQDWSDRYAAKEVVARVSRVEPYRPGSFYRRELPCLLAVIHPIISLTPERSLANDGAFIRILSS